jgi:hypothetical protein
LFLNLIPWRKLQKYLVFLRMALTHKTLSCCHLKRQSHHNKNKEHLAVNKLKYICRRKILLGSKYRLVFKQYDIKFFVNTSIKRRRTLFSCMARLYMIKSVIMEKIRLDFSSKNFSLFPFSIFMKLFNLQSIKFFFSQLVWILGFSRYTM